MRPWLATPDDSLSRLSHKDKMKMNKKYSLAFENYSKMNDNIFIDQNEYLEKVILENKIRYMVDYIHPNSKEGIKLYCESVFKIGKYI